MHFLWSLTLLGLLWREVLAVPSPYKLPRREAPASTPDAENAPSHICGEIIDAVNEGHRLFWAIDAFACLTSVPFNAAVALRFIEYYHTTMQFHSNLAYLKNPPAGYQQPSFDLYQSLEDLKQNVTKGLFKNQYAFEATLQSLVYAVHDTHVDLYAGILSTFSFASPFGLVTASKDGKEVPKVYIADDVYLRRESDRNISPIASINGEDVRTFLARFGSQNSMGMVEQHAEWNQLMMSPAQFIQGLTDVFSGSATFYPGDELVFTFENGTTLETFWLAYYNVEKFTGPLTTGGDYYNFFVLNNIPESYDQVPLPDVFNLTFRFGEFTDAEDQEVTEPQDADYNEISGGAYPRPQVKQPGLSVSGGGALTGYFLEDISTGVLSIPTFQQDGEDKGRFADTVDKFIADAQDKGITKVVIDLQQNSGGNVDHAFVTFRQFFPGVEPFAGSRRRSHDLANVVGSTITGFWDSLSHDIEEERVFKYRNMANEWIVTPRINEETGANFTSWEEYYGPVTHNGDQFSRIEQYDLANIYFDMAAFEGWIPVQYTPEAGPQRAAPWEPEQVVLLTDGTCASTCALFVEMMTQQAKVRSIVVGGAPTPGPMQAASGSRGARSDSSYTLDGLFATVLDLNLGATVPRGRNPGMSLTMAGLTLRDQMRKGNPIPLQYTYVAADCRLYFTLDNVFNMTTLWRDVSQAAWGKKNLCVEGSVGYASHGGDAPDLPPPKVSATAPPSPAFELGIDLDAGEVAEGITAGPVAFQEIVGIGQPCSTQPCSPDLECRPVLLSCPLKPGALKPQLIRPHICVMSCDTQQPWMCEQGGANSCGALKSMPTRKLWPPTFKSQPRLGQGVPNAQGSIISRQPKPAAPPVRPPSTGPTVPPANQPIGVPHGNPVTNPGAALPKPGGNFQSGRLPVPQTKFRAQTQEGLCRPRRATAQMGCL